MSISEQPDSDNLKDLQSILGSLESNWYWPFTEGVYLLDELKPWAAAAYTFIVICLTDNRAVDSYDRCVAACEGQFSYPFRQIAKNLLTSFPIHVFKQKASKSQRKSLTDQWHKQFRLMMKQYFAEKGYILNDIASSWIQKYFKPARGEFGDIKPMLGLLQAAMVYETISVPLVEGPPEGFKPQSFHQDEKPSIELIRFLQAFRESTGIADLGSWEAVREPEFYKALNLSRSLAREKVKEAKSNVIGVRCYGERTLLRDAYCFKRVIIDGEKEAVVAGELCGFREAQYVEAQTLMSPYQSEDGSYYLTQAILDGRVSQRVLTTLFRAEEIKQAPGMPLDWTVVAKVFDGDNPTENEVSKAISPFTRVFDYPRKIGRPSSTI
jgi:hypothetical protein